MLTSKERAIVRVAPKLVGGYGATPSHRKYLCMGPNCWGEGDTPTKAIENAKKARGSVVNWKWILYDVQGDASITGMGDITYRPLVGTAQNPPPAPYIELGRYNG